MTASLLLGVDLGTTATKAALYRLDGTLVAEARTDVPLHHPHPGAVEQDSNDFYQSAATAIRQCLSLVSPQQVGGIAFASQMAGIGTIDENFQPATYFDSWLDMRCQPFIEDLDRRLGDEITAITGCPPTCNHGPKILWWKNERPRDYQRIAKFVTPSGYVAGRAVGLRAEDAFLDYTFLHFTALADTQQSTWSDFLLQSLNADREKLPQICEPWRRVGGLTEQAAADFGLLPETPVAAGCGDTAAGALGAGAVIPGTLLDTAGTAAVLACCTDRFVADTTHRALLTMRSVIPGVWNPLAYIGGGGLAVRWFRDEFGMDGESYDTLCDQAAAIHPGCDGLFFSPHLGGRICPAAAAMRGSWNGFSWGHTRAHFFRSVLEGVAYEYRYYLDTLRDLLPDLEFSEARVIGGGARADLWNRIKADVLGVPYRRVMRPESATWGAALIAGKAAGLIDDLADRALETSMLSPESMEPNPAHATAYSQSSARYRCWQQTLARSFAKYGQTNHE